MSLESKAKTFKEEYRKLLEEDFSQIKAMQLLNFAENVLGEAKSKINQKERIIDHLIKAKHNSWDVIESFKNFILEIADEYKYATKKLEIVLNHIKKFPKTKEWSLAITDSNEALMYWKSCQWLEGLEKILSEN